jgi:Flp pilus assembly protein TadG
MTVRMRRLADLWAGNAGTAAVEMALVLPAFVMIVVGGFYGAGLTFAASSMHYAVEAAARCASVQTTVCHDSGSIAAYAASHYDAGGAGLPAFTYSTSGCGHVVTGTLTYGFNTGLGQFNVPLTATSCFP